MSAINCFVMPDRAIMMTDAALYGRDLKVMGFGEKAFAIPGMKAAVAVRGPAHMGFEIAAWATAKNISFDELSERVEDDLHQWCRTNGSLVADDPFWEMQVVIAGWSDAKKKPRLFRFDTQSADGDSLASFAEQFVFVYPDTSHEEDANLEALQCVPMKHFGAHNFDPMKHGVQLMEAQRRTPCYTPLDEEAEGYVVGGWITLTEVGPKGVRQRTIHRWSDTPGSTIHPEPFEAPVAATSATVQAKPAPPSRAERRRAERMAA